MGTEIPGPDWRLLRELSTKALARFCERVLDQVGRMIADRSIGRHELYRKVFGYMKAQDEELAAAFDDMRRSMAIHQLALIHRHGLLTDTEFARFSMPTRERVKALQEIMGRAKPVRRRKTLAD